MTDRPRQTDAEFDAYADDYDAALNKGLALTGEPKEYYAQGRVKWLRRRLMEMGLPLPGSVLDFGCGTGTGATCLLDELGCEAYAGYDPSPASIEEARAQALGSRARFTSSLSELPANTYDLAFCNGVFHHIPPEERAAAVAAVWERLKPGGIFAFWENNRWNPLVHWVMSRVPFDKNAQMLFPGQARRLLKNGGLKPVRQDFLFVFPKALAAARRLEPVLCKLPLGGQYQILARKDGGLPAEKVFAVAEGTVSEPEN